MHLAGQTLSQSKSPFHVVSQQLVQLRQKEADLKQTLGETDNLVIRRLSPAQKSARAELRQVEKDIKVLKRSLKKLNALQEAAKKVGRDHGQIWLYGHHYHW